MAWLAVSDNAHSHPKMIAAGNAALGLWLRCGAYAAQHLTDGIVPGAIAKMYGSKPQIARLLAAGLWHEHGHKCPHPKCVQPQPGDFYIHDYLAPYNPSRAEVEQKRDRAAEKKRKQRAAQDAQGNRGGYDDDPHRNREGFDEESPANPSRNSDGAAGHGGTSPGDGSGTRARGNPSPPRPSHEGGAGRESGGRGRAALSPIPADWQPSDDDVQAAQLARADAGREQLTAQQIATVTRKFVRRMTDDQVTAAAWGGRWQQWAENERPEPAAGPGGVVVHLPGAMTKGQQQRAGLDRLRERMNGGHSA
ncbi:hypothetical protein ABZZ79_00940 [Streptomyces sp. NPDC006458]|uniref:hypothetical protein n=1 Tax=Streptomyces sp. NPDC006458 TaxID=3154302 RepID=UPI0033A220F3